MSLGPVVSGSALSEHEVIGTEDLSERSGADGVHGAGLKIDEDGAWYVLSTCSQNTSTRNTVDHRGIEKKHTKCYVYTIIQTLINGTRQSTGPLAETLEVTSLMSLTGGLIVVDVDALQLQVGVTVVCASGIDTVLV